MNIQRILFPTDFSHYNDAALKFASTLAAEAGATLYIVHIFDERDMDIAMGDASYLSDPILYGSSGDHVQRKARECLSKVVPTVAGLTYKHECPAGSPVPELLRFAETHNVDLIVMASHGRTGLPRLLMGSIAEGVMRKARCPVLVVKQPTGDPKPESTVAYHGAEG